MLAAGTPLNPAGTVLAPAEVHRIAEAVVAENRRRDKATEKPLYLLYDQVYWMLCYGSARHEAPVRPLPDAARYTVFVDRLSKAVAATGVRVGWRGGPEAGVAASRGCRGPGG